MCVVRARTGIGESHHSMIRPSGGRMNVGWSRLCGRVIVRALHVRLFRKGRTEQINAANRGTDRGPTSMIFRRREVGLSGFYHSAQSRIIAGLGIARLPSYPGRTGYLGP